MSKKCIAQNIVKFKRTKNIKYLWLAIWQMYAEKRTLEVIWSCWCFLKCQPSSINLNDSHNRIIKIVRGKKEDLISRSSSLVSRETLIERYSSNYKVEDLPIDFKYARPSSIIVEDDYLLVGEYADLGARISLITSDKCETSTYYNNVNSVRHIHSIHKKSENSFFISTGDSAKFLDLWSIKGRKPQFTKRIRKKLAGYTAAVTVDGIHYFGTDFSSRPNYIETLDGSKYFFPRTAYKMFVLDMLVISNQFIVAINTEHSPVGVQKAMSIFDTESKTFLYSELI